MGDVSYVTRLSEAVRVFNVTCFPVRNRQSSTWSRRGFRFRQPRFPIGTYGEGDQKPATMSLLYIVQTQCKLPAPFLRKTQ